AQEEITREEVAAAVPVTCPFVEAPKIRKDSLLCRFCLALMGIGLAVVAWPVSENPEGQHHGSSNKDQEDEDGKGGAQGTEGRKAQGKEGERSGRCCPRPGGGQGADERSAEDRGHGRQGLLEKPGRKAPARHSLFRNPQGDRQEGERVAVQKG